MKTIALVLFLLTYVLLLVFPKIRAYIALISATIFVLLGILPVTDVLSTVDWNVIMMIAGTMGAVTLFIESKMPSLLADYIIEKTPDVKWAIVSLALFAGFISAFVDNVATVLMVAPVALNIAKKLNISPVPSVIAIAISSNLQGAATLVGDTTSILLGGHANLNFLDFFFFKGRPGMFWIVEAGALISTLVLLYVFRKEKQPVTTMDRTVVTDYFPTVILVGIVVLLIFASFLPDVTQIGSFVFKKPATINGIICITMMIIGMVRNFIKTRDIKVFPNVLKEIDYTTILLLAGLFVVIGGIKEAGIIEDISKLFISVSKDNVFVIFTLIVWASVFISAFIDNIPYVATMLPVTTQIASTLGIDPYLLYFGLLIGATLGGNITPIGASANITGLGILRKEGYEVSVKQFMKISVPFTLSAVITGYLLVWFIW